MGIDLFPFTFFLEQEKYMIIVDLFLHFWSNGASLQSSGTWSMFDVDQIDQPFYRETLKHWYHLLYPHFLSYIMKW